MAAPHWIFAPFRLDLDNACVWRGAAQIALRPKTFAVLHYLVAHAGQLVTKDALLAAVWPETAVSDGVLKDCMYELRRALGDSAQAPQFIATVPRRGYRFLAPVVEHPEAVPAPASPLPPAFWGRFFESGHDTHVFTLTHVPVALAA
jgi:DNA-binding winged helix-turn-helix (wHTH) protein